MSERNGHIAIEDWTLPHNRPPGAYAIETETPNSTGMTPYNATYGEAVLEAKGMSPRYKVVKLSGPIVEYQTSALD